MDRSSSPPNRIIKSRNKKGSACTYCRQLKFKCDAVEQYPSPCSRCANAKDGRRCIVDPLFKRTASKQRLDSLEKELEQMRQELRHRQASPSTTSPSLLEPVSLEHETTEVPDPSPPPKDNSMQIGSNLISTEHVQGVELLPHVIWNLIEEFYAHFHDHFPILPDKATFLSRYNFNRLLLWTVLAIASRESLRHSPLYANFVDPVRRLAGEVYASQSRSFETVQALLLLCVWPFPFQQTINDPSPMYVALASQIAYQLGLHRPSFRGDFTENNIPQADPGEHARKKVWFGCCIVNQFVTSKLGTPSTIRPGHAVLAELAQDSLSIIPEPMISQLHLTYLANKAFTALGDFEYDPSGTLPDCLSTVRSLEAQFLSANERLHHRWGMEMQLLYYVHLLHLYSFALDTSRNNVSHGINVEVDIIYARAYETVLKLCQLASTAPKSSTYWPVFAKYTVTYGLLFAVPFVNMEEIGSSARENLLEAIRGGLKVMKSWPLFDKDHFARVSAHVEWLIMKLEQADRGDLASPVTIFGLSTVGPRKKRLVFAVKSRMSTNIMYETIWTAKYGAKAEGLTRNQTLPAVSSFAVHNSNGESALDAPLNLPPLDPGLDNFVFTDGWENSGFLDIFADWQSLIGTTG